MKQNEKTTPIARPAWFVVPAKLAIIAVSRQTDTIQPTNPVTMKESD
jgi:hypothetical protein